ncbi:MAG: hypothetical protein ACRYF2_20360 [Janthinobacterium lividum]
MGDDNKPFVARPGDHRLDPAARSSGVNRDVAYGRGPIAVDDFDPDGARAAG